MTPKQLELLTFLIEYKTMHHVMPSFDEMSAGLDQSSKGNLHRYLAALQKQGYIRREAGRARAIEILRLPDGSPAPPASSFFPETATSEGHPFYVDDGVVWRRAGREMGSSQRADRAARPVAVMHWSAGPLAAENVARLMNLGHIAQRIVEPVRLLVDQHTDAERGVAHTRLLLTELEALI